VRGPTSYEDLKSIDGIVYETYREACERFDLLKNDKHWDNTLSEANGTKRSSQIRSLFVIILTLCVSSNPQQLWDKYKKNMSEIILYRKQKLDNCVIDYTDAIFIEAHTIIENACLLISGKN